MNGRTVTSVLGLLLLATGCFGPWKPLDGNAWIPPWREPVPSPRPYRAIALHASGAERGNAALLAEASSHGLAHHFVIGNGSASGNGQIEFGSRWKEQAPSAQDGSETIDICMIGTFTTEAPLGQTASALKLVVYLTEAYRIPDEAIRFSTSLTEGSVDPEEFVRLLEGARLDIPDPPRNAPPLDPEPFGLP